MTRLLLAAALVAAFLLSPSPTAADARFAWSSRPARSSPCTRTPSGDPEPSRADIDMTRRIQSALKTIGVTLLDHVIVTPSDSMSFQERSLL